MLASDLLDTAALTGNIHELHNALEMPGAKDGIRTALRSACHLGYAECVEALIAAGARASFGDVFCASVEGHAAVVAALLDSSAALVKDPVTLPSCLDSAVRNGNKDVVEVLLRRGAVVEKECVALAMASGHTDIATVLTGARRQFDAGASSI